jgi:hypothetical protein
MMNSIYDNSDFPVYREDRPKAPQDVSRGTVVEDDGPQFWTQPATEPGVSEDQRIAAVVDEFESARDQGFDDKNIYIDSLLGKRAEFFSGGNAEGPFGENGCRIYMVRNVGGGRSFYLQPSGSGIEIPIGASDGAAGGLDVLALSMKMRAAEARYSESFKPYAKPASKPAKDEDADRGVSDGAALASFLPSALFG